MRRLASTLGILLSAVACDGPTRPTAAPTARPGPATLTPGPPIPVSNPLGALAGAYTLTIDIPDACPDLPDAARRRTYDVTLVSSPYQYLGIRIVGGGYGVPTGVGDMWDAGQGRVSIDWNNFDIYGCDGSPEALPDGRTLMICGGGLGVVDGTTIAVNFEGQVLIEEQGRGRLSCIQRLPFTFRRVAARIR